MLPCAASHPVRLFASTHPTKSRRQPLVHLTQKSLSPIPDTHRLSSSLLPDHHLSSASDPTVSPAQPTHLRSVKSPAHVPSPSRKKSPSESPRHAPFPSADHAPHPSTQNRPTPRLGLGTPSPTFDKVYAANLPLLAKLVSAIQNSIDARTCRLLASLLPSLSHPA